MLQLQLLLLVCFSTILGQRRVLFGNRAELGKFPFIVSIRLKKPSDHTCSGSIITKKHVLTAAHCFSSYNSKAEIVVGTNDLSESGAHHKLKNTILHSMYDDDQIINDIAIIKIKSIIQFNNVTKRICLRTSEVPPFSEVTTIGWGCAAAKIKEIYVEYVTFATVLTVPQKYCTKYWMETIPESNICTFSIFEQGLCSGDSGGPLVYQGSQIGIASYGREYVNGNFDVFTNVSKFIDWIYHAKKYSKTHSDQFVIIKPTVNQTTNTIVQRKKYLNRNKKLCI